MTQYTASSSRNAQLSQLDLVFDIHANTEKKIQQVLYWHCPYACAFLDTEVVQFVQFVCDLSGRQLHRCKQSLNAL